MTTGPTILSFASAKGGAGRTMLAANVAAICAAGCPWANLEPRVPLLIDADLTAPGLHHYDFAEIPLRLLGMNKRWTYSLRKFHTSDFRDLQEQIRLSRDCGLLYLLKAIVADPAICKCIATMSRSPRNDQAVHKTVFEVARSVLIESIDEDDSPLNPQNHLITLTDAAQKVRLLLLPAAAQEQERYWQSVGEFSWSEFYQNNAGLALFQALLDVLTTRRLCTLQGPSEIGCVLLDQSGGRTLPSFANQLFAHYSIFISTFGRQHLGGLTGWLRDESTQRARARIVLSQYQGRGANLFTPHSAMHTPYEQIALVADQFPHADRERLAAVEELKRRDVAEEQIFLIDFLPQAVNREFLADATSPYYGEVVRLLVSVDSSDQASDSQQPSQAISVTTSEVRVLGEYAGISGHEMRPSGALGAFYDWLRKTTNSSISGLAMTHEDIAELIANSSVTVRVPRKYKSLWNTNSLIHANTNPDRQGKQFVLRLEDIDILALPAYLLKQAHERLHPLRGVEVPTIRTADCVGPISTTYLEMSINGWGRYTHIPTSGNRVLYGYPLFTHFPLIAYNGKLISKERFGPAFFRTNLREFNGFLEPIDLLAAARAAKDTDDDRDEIILALRPRHITIFYEWLTVVGAFGGQILVTPDVTNEITAAELNDLLSEEVVEGTLAYLELADYAETDTSEHADWDKAIQHFYDREDAGMALIWPDAIPLQFKPLRDSYPAAGYNRRLVADLYSAWKYALAPAAYHYEDCWLLTVPKGHANPEEMEMLLRTFMSCEAQIDYQKLGGVTPHMRVARRPDLWGLDPSLILLTLYRDHADARTVLPRRAARNSRPIAKELASRIYDLFLVAKERSTLWRGAEERTEGRHSPWRDTRFRDDLHQQVEDCFKRLISSCRKNNIVQ